MKSKKSKKTFLSRFSVWGMIALFIIVSTTGIGQNELKSILSKVIRLETATIVSNDHVERVPDLNLEGKELKVHFIDVGQADSIFIELPNSQSMLIDAGETGNGPEVVSYIKNAGYQTLDYVVATHPHADHIGGMATVIEELSINKFFMPKKEQTTKIFEKMIDALTTKSVEVYTAKSGVVIFEEGALRIEIVAPTSDTYSDLNNYSAVIRLTYGENSFLFTGDAEVDSEEQISQNLEADVLKVGHHGSDSSTSRDFLNRVNPKYAVISVGEGNKYDHPSPSVISKLEEAGVEIYRTDLLGTIVFQSDGHNISIQK
ncbi:MAG: ComEC/Rec2 family competence protein [Clostridiaceae bacterium]